MVLKPAMSGRWVSMNPNEFYLIAGLIVRHETEATVRFRLTTIYYTLSTIHSRHHTLFRS